MLSRGWWTRFWTLQEAVVSKVLMLQCGSGCLRWDDFSLFEQVMMLSLHCIRHHLNRSHRQSVDGKLLVLPVETIQNEGSYSIAKIRDANFRFARRNTVSTGV